MEGSGPPLIFVPGMDGTGRLFYRQAPLLASRFRVATFTAPGVDLREILREWRGELAASK